MDRSFGTGRTIVGVDSSDTDFDTVRETGGSKTHTLTMDELPGYTHTITQFLVQVIVTMVEYHKVNLQDNFGLMFQHHLLVLLVEVIITYNHISQSIYVEKNRPSRR